MIETKKTNPIISILAVDDEFDNLLLITSYLKKSAVKIKTALNGGQALEMAKEKRFDIILMDINMPGLNGIDAAKMIKTDSKNMDTKILALTGFNENELDLPSHFEGVVRKPISKETLFKNLSLSLT